METHDKKQKLLGNGSSEPAEMSKRDMRGTIQSEQLSKQSDRDRPARLLPWQSTKVCIRIPPPTHHPDPEMMTLVKMLEQR